MVFEKYFTNNPSFWVREKEDGAMGLRNFHFLVLLCVLVGIPIVMGSGVPEIDSLLAGNRPVLVYVYTDWCTFCAEQTPIIDDIEGLFGSEVAFLRINAGENPVAACQMSVYSYPAIFLIMGRNGEGYTGIRFSGFTARDVLVKSITGTSAQQTVTMTLNTPGISTAAGEGCSSLEDACGERCDEICERATNLSWKCSVFCCAERICDFTYDERYCEIDGYVECATPLLESYYGCLEECIEEYPGLNTSEKADLRATCRTACNENFYSQLHATCRSDACPEYCIEEAYHNGSYRYWQNSPGSYTGKCDCYNYEVGLVLKGPNEVLITEDGILIGEPEPFNTTAYGEDVDKVKTIRWLFGYRKSDESWGRLDPIITDPSPLYLDESLLQTIAGLVARYGEGPEGEKSLWMNVTVETYLDGEVVLAHSSSQDFVVQVRVIALEGRITAFDHPVKHIKIEFTSAGRSSTTTTDSQGRYASDLEIGDDSVSMEISFEYSLQGTNYFMLTPGNREPFSLILNVTEGRVKSIFSRYYVNDEGEPFRVQTDFEMPEVLELDSLPEWREFKDFSAFYIHVTEVLEFYQDQLGVVFDLNLPLYVYLFSSKPLSYGHNDSISLIHVPSDKVEYINSFRPQNREYHEFSHYAMHNIYGGQFPVCGPGPVEEINHGGYVNPCTADSFVEGFAYFMSAVIGEYYDYWWNDGHGVPQLLGIIGNLDDDYRAWDSFGQVEDRAVAGVLWDLYDGEAQAERESIAAAVDIGLIHDWMVREWDLDGDGKVNLTEQVCWSAFGSLKAVGSEKVEIDFLAQHYPPWYSPYSPSEIRDIFFGKFDINQDMVCSANELDEYRKDIGQDQYNLMMEDADVNHDGAISEQELLQVVELRRSLDYVVSWMSKDDLDADGDGYLNKIEFHRLVTWSPQDVLLAANNASRAGNLFGHLIPRADHSVDQVSLLPLMGLSVEENIEQYSKRAEDDGADLTLEEIWGIISQYHSDFTSVYEAFKDAFPGIADEIDEIFVAHGFYADRDSGNRIYDEDEPFRDQNGNLAYDPGEYFVDLAEGGMKYDEGRESIGNATNYERLWRRSLSYLPGHFVKVSDQAASFRVKISIWDEPVIRSPFPERIYEFSTPNINGMIYVQVPPPIYYSEVTITAEGCQTGSPLKYSSIDFYNVHSQSAAQGYYIEHDFAIGEKGLIWLPTLLIAVLFIQIRISLRRGPRCPEPQN